MGRSPLEVLPQDVTDYLVSNPWFDDVPVFFYREGRIAEEINRTLAGQKGKGGKLGAAVVVNMPVFAGEAEPPGPELAPTITIECVEHPILNFGTNGTQKSAERIAHEVAQQLQHHFADCYYTALYPVREGFIVPSRGWENYVAYNVRFACRMALEDLARVAMPTITPNGGEGATLVTLSCITTGATIYYTLDESYPRPAAAGGAIGQQGYEYTGPFTAPGGTVVRAAAYRYGMIGSYVACAEFGAVVLAEEQNAILTTPGGEELST